MDHYADDLAALTAHLDLKSAVHVGHPTGGGEVVHPPPAKGDGGRLAKAGRSSACGAAADGADRLAQSRRACVMSCVRRISGRLAANRSEFYRDVPAGPFYGYNRPRQTFRPVIQNWWRQGMMAGPRHITTASSRSRRPIHRGLEESPVGPGDAWRRRPDRALRGLRPFVGQAFLKNGSFKNYKVVRTASDDGSRDHHADLLAFIKS